MKGKKHHVNRYEDGTPHLIRYLMSGPGETKKIFWFRQKLWLLIILCSGLWYFAPTFFPDAKPFFGVVGIALLVTLVVFEFRGRLRRNGTIT